MHAASRPPRVSIVVACVNGLPYIEDCLSSFERQRGDIPYEMIVVHRCDGDCREVVRRYAGVRSIWPGRPELTVPELRALGIRHARGALIGITEDHCIAPDTWLAAMVAAHDEGHQIVGGPIENAATHRLADWTHFFGEYSGFVPPLPPGRRPVPGNNVTYDRALLSLVQDLLDRGVWEEELNARLATLGYETHMEPKAVMLHKKSFGLRDLIMQRYHYARSYGGMRVRRAGRWRRGLYAFMAATVLAPMLLIRIVRSVWSKGRHRRELVLSLPLLLVFVTSWGWGEAVGYLRGAGDSLRKVT